MKALFCAKLTLQNNTAFWEVIAHDMVEITDLQEEYATSIFRVEEEVCENATVQNGV
jgi:hypothetical protein